ncbi:site-2 protease family protein [Natranaerobius thermophilus]|uniref:Zinc metalloprotease n=1 Tax=Natranaerobius thermophilus (strain ATCC BAA-1301 / DSM 18059 / JW/NM-WN-LF) TaxID=457570 RepID=B2A5G6_NATTJ|nr:site-2 protease family protein [Natranaerobius thermophilus]ACB85321.1 peptidase M50 [Natranaerobius thermophilus JW/NM-WN-LF]
MFSNSLRIARFFGIDVELDFSWLVIFMVFSFSLSTNYFPNVLAEKTDLIYWLAGVTATIMLFISVLIHEFAHSLTALKEGHDIKKITLFIFGGVAQLDEEPRTSVSELKITIVGPVSSLALAAIFGPISLLFTEGHFLGEILFFLARVNLTIGILNLIPAFPLDGGRILRAAIWYFKKDLLLATKISVLAGSALAFLLMGMGFMITVTVSVMGLWYIFMGWLLYQAGQNSYTQVTLKNTLSGYQVQDVMTDNVLVVSTELTIDRLVEEFYRHKVGAFPVVGGSAVLGLVTMNQVKTVNQDEWEVKKVREIMTAIDECIIMEPEEEAVEAMMKMARHNAGRVLVMDAGRLVGILSNTDMMRLIKMKTLFEK